MGGEIIKNIFHAAITVTVFSCAERFLGFIYRIYLSRTLGAEGLGIYQIALSVLGLFMTITSSGIPITVSRMMIKYKEEDKQNRINGIVTAGVLCAIALCLPLTLLVFSKSGFLGFLFSDKRCLPVLTIMIPGLTFTSVYAVIRGTFWGNKAFLPYSIIEFAEESVMLIAGIILVNGATGVIDGVNKAGYAVLISYLFSFTVSVIYFFAKGGRLKSPKSELKPLIKSATPITAMKTATSLINTLIAVILPARLILFGFSTTDAVAKFGKVFGMAFPLIFMPSTLIGSLALVLVPELSSNYYSKNFKSLKTNIEKALKFAIFISCLIIPVFLTAGKELGYLLYSDYSVGEYVVKATATMLPMSIAMISTSMLNSLNKEKQTLLSFFSGASVMIICIYFLPPLIGIDALILGMFLNYTITAIINVILLYKTSRQKFEFLKPLIICCILVVPSVIFGTFAKNTLSLYLNESFSAIVCSFLVVCFYFTLTLAFGLLDFVFENKKSKLQIFKKPNTLNNWN